MDILADTIADMTLKVWIYEEEEEDKEEDNKEGNSKEEEERDRKH